MALAIAAITQLTEAKDHGVNEDALAVEQHPSQSDLILVFLADGQGGQPGGALAAQTAIQSGIALAKFTKPTELLKGATWIKLLKRVDNDVVKQEGAGFTTLIGLCAGHQGVVGASNGDSTVMCLDADSAVRDLTEHQRKNPPIGSGSSEPRAFSATLRAPWKLLVMSDGVTNYVYPDKLLQIVSQNPAESATGLLLDEAKNRSGGLMDDFSIVILKLAETKQPTSLDADPSDTALSKADGSWFRLHLSTAVLLSITGSALLGLDVTTLAVLNHCYGNLNVAFSNNLDLLVYLVLLECCLIAFVVLAFEWDIRRKRPKNPS